MSRHALATLEKLYFDLAPFRELVSLDDPVEADDGDELHREAIIPAPQPSALALIERDRRARLLHLQLDSTLHARLAAVLILRHGLPVEWPLRRIGAAFGVSKQRTAVLERDALRAMREVMR